MKKLKEFKRQCVQDKSIFPQFLKWFLLTFLCCLIGIYLGLIGMIKDGSMDKLLEDVDPSLKHDFLIIALSSYILVAALVSIFFAINIVLRRNK